MSNKKREMIIFCAQGAVYAIALIHQRRKATATLRKISKRHRELRMLYKRLEKEARIKNDNTSNIVNTINLTLKVDKDLKNKL